MFGIWEGEGRGVLIRDRRGYCGCRELCNLSEWNVVKVFCSCVLVDVIEECVVYVFGECGLWVGYCG